MSVAVLGRMPEELIVDNVQSEWVFAYGSNMDLPDVERWMSERGHDDWTVLDARPAVLADHKLVWNYFSRARSGGAANVEPTAGSCVPGVALCVTWQGLAAIDAKEGHPNVYSRGAQPVAVQLLDTDVEDDFITAWVYRVLPSYQEQGYVAPRRAYLNHLMRGAKHFALPDWHQEALKSIPTAD